MAFFLLTTLDPEEGFMDMSIPDISLKAFKAAKKGRNPDLPNFREAVEGPHAEEFKKAIQKEISQLEKHKSKPIIVSCRSGAQSAQACRQLRGAGLGEVYNLKGGMLAWQSANLPVSRKRQKK